VRENLILPVISEKSLVLVAAQIFEWQYCDALVEHTQGRGSRAAGKEKRAADNRSQHEQRDCNRRPAHMSAAFLDCLKLLRRCGVARSIARQIYDTDADAMLHFTFTKIVQKRTPPRILLQIFCDMPRQQDVSGIPTVHDSLCNVNTGTSDVGLCIQIPDFV